MDSTHIYTYNKFKKLHPEWSDEQIWTAISLDHQADIVIEKAGADIDAKDPIIFTWILEGAREWLRQFLPVVFEKVKSLFSAVLTQLMENVKSFLAGGWQQAFTRIIQSIF